jgi:hypothetical protein
MKILPMGTNFFFMRTRGRTGRQADMTKLIVAFHYSAKAPNSGMGDSKMLICGNAYNYGHLGLFLQG